MNSSFQVEWRILYYLSTPSQLMEAIIQQKEHKQAWTQREHDVFVSLIEVFGRNFRAYETFLPGRNYNSIKSFYHNNKATLPVNLIENNKKDRNHRKAEHKRMEKSIDSRLDEPVTRKEEIVIKKEEYQEERCDEYSMIMDFLDVI